jgi:hypothetical protein
MCLVPACTCPTTGSGLLAELRFPHVAKEEEEEATTSQRRRQATAAAQDAK